jgi:hypothetical protein
MNRCPCGGETQLEYFDHPKGIQWFMRCRSCGEMSESAKTEDEAKMLPVQIQSQKRH